MGLTVLLYFIGSKMRIISHSDQDVSLLWWYLRVYEIW